MPHFQNRREKENRQKALTYFLDEGCLGFYFFFKPFETGMSSTTGSLALFICGGMNPLFLLFKHCVNRYLHPLLKY